MFSLFKSWSYLEVAYIFKLCSQRQKQAILWDGGQAANQSYTVRTHLETATKPAQTLALASFDVSCVFRGLIKSSSLGHHTLKILNSVHNHSTPDNQAQDTLRSNLLVLSNSPWLAEESGEAPCLLPPVPWWAVLGYLLLCLLLLNEVGVG